ncbi:MAG: hypothetical protein JNK05_25130 [Myxococcales bacterium]|nr:hypothetical protein [Myxococcales bacterium]
MFIARGTTVTSAAEGEGLVRSHERYARIRVRVERAAPLGLQLSHELAPNDELFEFWPGVIDGVRMASAANRSLAVKVTVLSAAVHPVDSRRTSFARATSEAIAQAIARTGRVEVTLDRELFPCLATIDQRAEVRIGGGVLSSEPLDLVLEQPLSWSCVWATIDPEARRCVEALVRERALDAAPWSNATLHFGASLAAGEAPSSDEIREAICSVIAKSRPVVRHARAMSVRDDR